MVELGISIGQTRYRRDRISRSEAHRGGHRACGRTNEVTVIMREACPKFISAEGIGDRQRVE
jgi:hypothetical protein